MNNALKKDEKYRNKYMKTHKMLTLLLDKERDADIIRWLESQDNRSKAVRTAIRNEIVVEDSKNG
jgi:hypothetical protein